MILRLFISDCFWRAFQSSCITERFFLSYCKRAGEGQLLGAEKACLNKLLFVSVVFEHRFFLLCLPILEKSLSCSPCLQRKRWGFAQPLGTLSACSALTKHLNHCSHRVHMMYTSFVKWNNHFVPRIPKSHFQDMLRYSLAAMAGTYNWSNGISLCNLLSITMCPVSGLSKLLIDRTNFNLFSGKV